MPAVGFSFNQRGGSSSTGSRANTVRCRTASTAGWRFCSTTRFTLRRRSTSRFEDSGIIEGRFTSKEVNELVNVLNAGALEVPLVSEPISELTISPTLGLDVQKKGMTAIVVSSVLVFVFMLIYYHFAGLVADLCLTLNLILLFGIMAVIDSAFTLPGFGRYRADDRYRGRLERADLRANARRTRTRLQPADGDSQRL